MVLHPFQKNVFKHNGIEAKNPNAQRPSLPQQTVRRMGNRIQKNGKYTKG